jgi:hypothetical protein
MTEYSRMAKGSFTATGASQYVYLPFQPDYVELWNYTNIKTAAVSSTTRAWWDGKLLDPVTNAYPTMVEIYNAAGATIFDTIQANGISAFSAGLGHQFGPLQGHNLGSITDFSIATSASPTVITTVGTDHGLQSGDVIVFQNLSQTVTTGFQQIAGIMFTVTRVSANSFSIPWISSGSNYTAFNTATSTGNVGTYRKVLYPYLYAPGVSVISAITLGATTTIKTTSAHNFVVGQEVAIRIPTVRGAPTVWGPTELNSLPNTTIPGSPIYGYVVAVTDYNTVVVNINSTNYTAFNPNLPFALTAGATPAQIVAVGDVNTGGVQISANSALYPPPYVVPIGTTRVNTINGPAIQGAFFNNTRQGFYIGSGLSRVTPFPPLMEEGDIIYYHAYYHDLSLPF